MVEVAWCWLQVLLVDAITYDEAVIGCRPGKPPDPQSDLET